MPNAPRPLRVLYSFPHKLGAGRICYTAWQQVNGLVAAGAEVLVHPGVLHRPLPAGVKVEPTVARGAFRIPYKIIGKMRALAFHDYVVSRRIEKLADRIDVIHTWPLAAARTLRAAKKLGIPTVLERPNANTRFAYEVVRAECQRLDIQLPSGNEYAFRDDLLRKEEEEYDLADFLLCPSDFVRQTFIDRRFAPGKLLRHQYGYDETKYYPASSWSPSNDRGLKMIFVGDCAVRKGLHFALEAWLKSPAHQGGTFAIAGHFLPAYADKLAGMLSHPSIQVLGFRDDIPELMRSSDILVLPSLEEGSALVTSDARGSGCVLLVSEAAGAICTHMQNGLVHRAGDVAALANHITLLYNNRSLLNQLRNASLSTTNTITWAAAGNRLLQVYRDAIATRSTGEVAGRVRPVLA